MGIITHNMSKTRLYKCWKNMKARCYIPSASRYKNYGERGISVCKEWLNFELFMQWALNNGYTDNLTIDRINNDGDYCPENCRWVTIEENTSMMMEHNQNNNLGLFSNSSKMKSKDSNRINNGKKIICNDGTNELIFNSRGELADYLLPILKRNRNSIKSQIMQCISGKVKTIGRYTVYE